MHPTNVTKVLTRVFAAAITLAILGPTRAARADETCQSPYMAMITSQEDFVYVWTLGKQGVGDGSDKLVSIDVRPDSKTFGKVIHTVSVGGRNEAHHGGFTDDRRYFWAGGLDTSKIFIFDVHTDPARPRLDKTINDFVAKIGRRRGPAHALRAARADAHRGAIERQGPRRPHGARGIQQQRRVHRDALDADRRKADGRESRQVRRRLRVRRARPAAAKHAAHLVVHRLEQLHDGPRQDAARTRRR